MSYEQDAIDVAKTLGEDGQTIVLRKIAAGTYASGVVNTNNKDYERNGLPLDYNRTGSGQTAYDLVKRGDKQLYMEAGVEPTIKDKVIIGNITYGIENVKELSPGGVVIMYELHLRKS